MPSTEEMGKLLLVYVCLSSIFCVMAEPTDRYRHCYEDCPNVDLNRICGNVGLQSKSMNCNKIVDQWYCI